MWRMGSGWGRTARARVGSRKGGSEDFWKGSEEEKEREEEERRMDRKIASTHGGGDVYGGGSRTRCQRRSAESRPAR